MTATDDLCRSYNDLRWHLDPAAATLAGIREQDGRLGAFDQDGMREHLAAFRAIAGAIEDLDLDDPQEEIDRVALLDEIRVTIFRFTHEEPHRRNPAFWLNHLAEAMHGLLLRRGGEPDVRAASSLARLSAVPEWLAMAEKTLRSVPDIFRDTALALSDAIPELLFAVADMAAEENPASAQDARAAATTAVDALARFRLALRPDEPRPGVAASFAAGEEQFERRLHHEHALAISSAEAYRVAMHAEEAFEAELDRLGAEVDPAMPWREVAGRLFEDAGPSPDAVAEAARDSIAAAGTVPMLPGELVFAPLPAWLRVLHAGGRYLAPPHRADDHVGTILTDADGASTPVWAFAWPGEHLRVLAARELASTVRRSVVSPVMLFGWGLYAGDLLEEAGCFVDPEAGFLRQLHLYRQAVLGRLDVALHTRAMQPDEAVDALLEALPLPLEVAWSDVRRLCLFPGRHLGAILGRRELLRLRDAVREREGPAFDSSAYHAALLAHGGLPVTLVRWSMGIEEA